MYHIFRDSEDNKKMEKISNRLVPMHKKLIENMTNNIVIKSGNKLFSEDMVIFIEN